MCMIHRVPPLSNIVVLADRWQAHLCLGVTGGRRGTRLGERIHSGPFRFQKPLYPEGARVLLTTPGAGKWHRANGRCSHHTELVRALRQHGARHPDRLRPDAGHRPTAPVAPGNGQCQLQWPQRGELAAQIVVVLAAWRHLRPLLLATRWGPPACGIAEKTP